MAGCFVRLAIQKIKGLDNSPDAGAIFISRQMPAAFFGFHLFEKKEGIYAYLCVT
ncbi:hypothetical protein HNR65_001259 [Desulfosalsimonas propionicica]|uniref:Uncharacterized protein n=1 Tax=Desulfosalsimonas propionicica TaxID=332175 RepID=A0A7W0C858_9BACT|nr:hypothetical protein [Desulfosalsimonas propionicica]